MDKKSLIFFLFAFLFEEAAIKQKIHNVCVNLNEMC